MGCQCIQKEKGNLDNEINDLFLYNINMYSTNYKDNKKETNINNLIDKFKLECVIGKGGFGKVSYIVIIK